LGAFCSGEQEFYRLVPPFDCIQAQKELGWLFTSPITDS
jgi:hypothetical protein